MGRSIENGSTVNINLTQSTGFADGSPGAPSLWFANDSNTGIYRQGSETIAFTSNGNKTADISPSGLNIVNKVITPGLQLTTNPGVNKVLQSDASGNASWGAAIHPSIQTYRKTAWDMWQNTNPNYTFTVLGLNVTILNAQVLILSGRMQVGFMPTGHSNWHRLTNSLSYGIDLHNVHGIVYDRLTGNTSFPSYEASFRLTSNELEFVLENSSGGPITNQFYDFMAIGRVE